MEASHKGSMRLERDRMCRNRGSSPRVQTPGSGNAMRKTRWLRRVLRTLGLLGSIGVVLAVPDLTEAEGSCSPGELGPPFIFQTVITQRIDDWGVEPVEQTFTTPLSDNQNYSYQLNNPWRPGGYVQVQGTSALASVTEVFHNYLTWTVSHSGLDLGWPQFSNATTLHIYARGPVGTPCKVSLHVSGTVTNSCSSGDQPVDHYYVPVWTDYLHYYSLGTFPIADTVEGTNASVGPPILYDGVEYHLVSAFAPRAECSKNAATGPVTVVGDLQATEVIRCEIMVGQPPTVAARGSCQVAVGDTARFEALASDPDGGALCYKWTVPGASSVVGGNTPNCRAVWDTAGTFNVECVVTDPQGHTASDTWAIQVASPTMASVLSGPQCAPCRGEINPGDIQCFNLPDSDDRYNLYDVGATMFVTATIEEPCVCCEYRQYVRGLLIIDDKQRDYKNCHQDPGALCGADGKYVEDCTSSGGYGDRRKESMTELCDEYFSDPGHDAKYSAGCYYQGCDAPGTYALPIGTKYEVIAHFEGTIEEVCSIQGAVGTHAEWDVACCGYAGMSGFECRQIDLSCTPRNAETAASNADAMPVFQRQTATVGGREVSLSVQEDEAHLVVEATIWRSGKRHSVVLDSLDVQLERGTRTHVVPFFSDALGGFHESVMSWFAQPAATPRVVVVTVNGETARISFDAVAGVPATAPGGVAGLALRFPNPYHAGQRMQLSGLGVRDARADVYSISGAHIATLPASEATDGLEVTWDGRDHAGAVVPHGVYFVRVTTPQKRMTSRLIMLR